MVETGPSESQGSTIFADLSISEYLYRSMIQNAFDGPLTEDENVTDDDDAAGTPSHIPTPPSPAPSTSQTDIPSPAPPTSHKKGDKIRSKRRRQMRRLLEGKDGGGTSLKGVSKKRVKEATRDVFKVDFVMSMNSAVTQPGWIGRPNVNLPTQPVTLTDAVGAYGLTHFPWEGQYVSFLPCNLPFTYKIHTVKLISCEIVRDMSSEFC